MFPFLCLSLIISCFRVEGLALQEGLGWRGRAALPSRRRNMSFGNNFLSFGPLSSSWCYRGGGVRALGKVGLPIFSDWPSPTSHFMSCKILYVFAVFWRGRVFSQFPFFPFICQFRALCQLLLLHWVGWFFKRGWARFSQLLPCHGHSSSFGCLCLLRWAGSLWRTTVGCFCLRWQPSHSRLMHRLQVD